MAKTLKNPALTKKAIEIKLAANKVLRDANNAKNTFATAKTSVARKQALTKISTAHKDATNLLNRAKKVNVNLGKIKKKVDPITDLERQIDNIGALSEIAAKQLVNRIYKQGLPSDTDDYNKASRKLSLFVRLLIQQERLKHVNKPIASMLNNIVDKIAETYETTVSAILQRLTKKYPRIADEVVFNTVLSLLKTMDYEITKKFVRDLINMFSCDIVGETLENAQYKLNKLKALESKLKELYQSQDMKIKGVFDTILQKKGPTLQNAIQKLENFIKSQK